MTDGWSKAEKRAAREAYHRAFERQLAATLAEAKTRLADVKDLEDFRALERWFKEQRRKFEEMYDFRASVLVWTLGAMRLQGLLTREELAGIGPDNLDRVETFVRLTHGRYASADLADITPAPTTPNRGRR